LAEHAARIGTAELLYSILFGKPQKRRPTERMCRWEDITKISLREMRREVVSCRRKGTSEDFGYVDVCRFC